jgi:hypothetical protein
LTDLQLKDFANRIPNISAEVVADGDMQSDAVILTPATTMTKEGGTLDHGARHFDRHWLRSYL